MGTNKYMPESNVGANIDGICLEKALAERIYVSYAKPMSKNYSLNLDLVDWHFFVGIYKSQDKYYLLLDDNDDSSKNDMMIDDGVYPNTGFIQISESIAVELATKISNLGKEYFAIDIPNFRELMILIVSAMQCPVMFGTLLNGNGYFDRINEVIVVANNNSKFVMIWTLIHEYVHYLLGLLDFEKNYPRTMEEYFYDEEECICEAVAFELMISFFGIEQIKFIADNALLKAKNVCLEDPNLGDMKCDELSFSFSPEEQCILSYLKHYSRFKNKELEDTINSIIDRIMNAFDAQPVNRLEECVDCRQTGLVILSPVDNQTLYDIIVNDISPMIPEVD